MARGEGLRLWAVRHIGVISRTRSDRLGPLVATGPFALRFAIPCTSATSRCGSASPSSARLVWLVPDRHRRALARVSRDRAVGRRRCSRRAVGDEYRAYAGRVPRWIPSAVAFAPGASARPGRDARQSSAEAPQSPTAVGCRRYSWRETLFSERGTLIAIAVGYLLLWIKTRRLKLHDAKCSATTSALWIVRYSARS